MTTRTARIGWVGAFVAVAVGVTGLLFWRPAAPAPPAPPRLGNLRLAPMPPSGPLAGLPPGMWGSLTCRQPRCSG